MFSGIVESLQPILFSQLLSPSLIRIKVKKPNEFNDLKNGDSIAVDGVCLTVENFDAETITFAIAAETLQVLNWSSIRPESLIGREVNLERSLRFGDRIHGHLVTGHVDSLGIVRKTETVGEKGSDNFFLEIEVADSVLPFLWRKGSVTLNGVSLTVNEIRHSLIAVGLIPETLKRTNLGNLKEGDSVNVEPDYMAKAMRRMLETQNLKEINL